MLKKSPSVRLLVASIVLLPVVVSIALTALLFSTSRNISESLAGEIVDTETSRV